MTDMKSNSNVWGNVLRKRTHDFINGLISEDEYVNDHNNKEKINLWSEISHIRHDTFLMNNLLSKLSRHHRCQVLFAYHDLTRKNVIEIIECGNSMLNDLLTSPKLLRRINREQMAKLAILLDVPYLLIENEHISLLKESFDEYRYLNAKTFNWENIIQKVESTRYINAYYLVNDMYFPKNELLLPTRILDKKPYKLVELYLAGLSDINVDIVNKLIQPIEDYVTKVVTYPAIFRDCYKLTFVLSDLDCINHKHIANEIGWLSSATQVFP